MNSGRKVIFFGNERLVSGLATSDAPVLRALIAAGYHICAVVVNDAGTKSRRQKPLEIAELAAANNIPVHSPHRPMDIYDELAAYQADVAVLVAYGRIVPQKLIDLFPFGIVNVHPSLLPAYRGPSPIESVIARGDAVTGVSIMSLTAAMDAGPVYAQIEHPLTGHENATELSRTLATLAAAKLAELLPRILDGTVSPQAQDESKATYCQLIAKSDARLDPNTQTADQAERLVRAYHAYPRARLNLGGHDIIVLRAHVGEQSVGSAGMPFADGAFLCVDELIAPSGKSMHGDAFAKGYLNT